MAPRKTENNVFAKLTNNECYGIFWSGQLVKHVFGSNPFPLPTHCTYVSDMFS